MKQMEFIEMLHIHAEYNCSYYVLCVKVAEITVVSKL